MKRDLDWEGCLNVRDLGGLPTANGATTRWGAVVRSDNPAYLTQAGWEALNDHGIRTIIALRTVGAVDDEPDRGMVPADVSFQRVIVEDGTDPDFIRRCGDTLLFGTPIYFRDMLETWPHYCAAAVKAVVDAPPGGVVIACGRGCDRTGLTAFLLLGLAGVPADLIAEDWERSVERLRSRNDGYEHALQQVMDRENATVLGTITDTLTTMDIAARLTAGGLTPEDLEIARTRMITPV